MNLCIALLLTAALPLQPTLKMRRLAKYPLGPSGQRVVCCDSDHDSLPEMVFQTGTIYPPDPRRIELWEHQGWNRFKLVYADTGEYPEPNGITTGNAIPYDAGDADGDGLTEIVCTSDAFFYPDSMRNIIMTLESPDPHSYPCSLSWYYQGPSNYAGGTPACFTPDLDRDGHDEIMGWLDGIGTCIWENVGNDRYELRWTGPVGGCNFGFRDFDCDGRNDIGTGWYGAEVWECMGDDQYERVWCDTFRPGNGLDVWSTSDIDGDRRPEFYEAFTNFVIRRTWFYMFEAESEGSHQFTRTLVDSVGGRDFPQGLSAGGDIDGDGVDECIWTTLGGIRVYRAVGDNDLLKVWEWENDHVRNCPSTAVYDVNGDGYNEILFADNYETSVFEVDAVDLLSPNGGSCSVGDTVQIRWVTNYPPRCDSLSLFLRRDSLWHLTTIATGLPGTDMTYRWVVPAEVPETARVVVIAYGPGWQFDISDSAITFIGGGVAEGTHNVPLQWALSVDPNPTRGAFSVRYDVPTPTRVSVGIYDASGRLVRSLSEGEVSAGRHEAKLPSGTLSAGIYFLRLDTPGFRAVKKTVVTR